MEIRKTDNIFEEGLSGNVHSAIPLQVITCQALINRINRLTVQDTQYFQLLRTMIIFHALLCNHSILHSPRHLEHLNIIHYNLVDGT